MKEQVFYKFMVVDRKGSLCSLTNGRLSLRYDTLPVIPKHRHPILAFEDKELAMDWAEKNEAFFEAMEIRLYEVKGTLSKASPIRYRIDNDFSFDKKEYFDTWPDGTIFLSRISWISEPLPTRSPL